MSAVFAAESGAEKKGEPKSESPAVAAAEPAHSFGVYLLFAFIGSFDEVIVTSFIAGRYDTVPKKMFTELILEVNPTITAVATLLIAFTVLLLAAVAFILSRSGKLRQTLAS